MPMRKHKNQQFSVCMGRAVYTKLNKKSSKIECDLQFCIFLKSGIVGAKTQMDEIIQFYVYTVLLAEKRIRKIHSALQ